VILLLSTQPDFRYDGDECAAISVDGPPVPRVPHARDRAQTEAMKDRGELVIRFGHQGDWPAKSARSPYRFGEEQRC
jgi:hypothetical protein